MQTLTSRSTDLTVQISWPVACVVCIGKHKVAYDGGAYIIIKLSCFQINYSNYPRNIRFKS